MPFWKNSRYREWIVDMTTKWPHEAVFWGAETALCGGSYMTLYTC